LPDKFNTNYEKINLEILQIAQLNDTTNKFLIDIILRDIKAEGNLFDEKYHQKLENLFTKMKNLDLLIALFNKKWQKTEILLQEFLKLDRKLKRDKIIFTSSWNLSKFFQILENNKFEDYIPRIIDIPSEKDWQEKFESENWKNWSVISFWFNEGFSRELSEVEVNKFEFYSKFKK
jgi:hypothetical protein